MLLQHVPTLVGKELAFFKFPRNYALNLKWIRQVDRTRKKCSGLSEHNILCEEIADSFEPDCSSAASMGLKKRKRLKS